MDGDNLSSLSAYRRVNRAATAGKDAGSFAAYAAERGQLRDYSDDFVRSGLPESGRDDFKAAWYAAHKATLEWLRGGSTIVWLAGAQ